MRKATKVELALHVWPFLDCFCKVPSPNEVVFAYPTHIALTHCVLHYTQWNRNMPSCVLEQLWFVVSQAVIQPSRVLQYVHRFGWVRYICFSMSVYYATLISYLFKNIWQNTFVTNTYCTCYTPLWLLLPISPLAKQQMSMTSGFKMKKLVLQWSLQDQKLHYVSKNWLIRMQVGGNFVEQSQLFFQERLLDKLLKMTDVIWAPPNHTYFLDSLSLTDLGCNKPDVLKDRGLQKVHDSRDSAELLLPVFELMVRASCSRHNAHPLSLLDDLWAETNQRSTPENEEWHCLME